MTASWHIYFATIAQSAAALMGLLFVAASIHLDKIMGERILLLRARNSTIVMIILFLEAVAVLAPQDVRVVGIEILVLSLLQVSFPIAIAVEALRKKLKVPPLRIAAGILGGCLTAGGAVGLIMSQPLGLHFIAAGNITVMVVLVINAWSLMVSVWESERVESK
jgi:hypothetical protein